MEEVTGRKIDRLRHDKRVPCGNCPFRRSAPLAHWAPDHYLMLRDMEEAEGDFSKSVLFACHKDKGKQREERGMCVGWLLDQRRKGVPSIALRIHMMRHDAAVVQLSDVEADGELYGCVDELVRCNLQRELELHLKRYEDEVDVGSDQ